jgi:NAD(P)-dependent dehydrogenase (short-subunit alcohol dehydrogenase family)
MAVGAFEQMEGKSMSQYAIYPSLRERVVIVTGGGSGIGAKLVEHFAHQGAKVAFLDVAEHASRELIDSLAGKCSYTPMFFACDLTETTALQETLALICSSLGDADVLVNNAANDDRHRWQDVTPEYWDQRISVNLKHQFFAIQAIAPGMRAKKRGSIINMSSICWMIPSSGLPIYATSKAAIVGMTRAFAVELGSSNVRVNCVSAGAVLTERQKRLWLSPEYEAEVLSEQILKRHLVPDDVARLVLFLAADDSDGITSKNYLVDGGWI